MEEFLADILGQDLVITINMSDDFCLTCYAHISIVTDKAFILGENHFSMSLSESCTFTKADDTWVVKTPKKIELLISKLDKIR